MRKLIVLVLFFVLHSPVHAQYKFAVGVSVGSASKTSSPGFPATDSLIYELSLKFTGTSLTCTDVSIGTGKDFYRFTVMKEMHKPLFYPVDAYLGLGFHAGSFKDNHWPDAGPHKKFFGGLDGVLGLQITVRPISVSISTLPVYNLFGADNFLWEKQIGFRICL